MSTSFLGLPKHSCVRWVPPDAEDQHSSNLRTDRLLGIQKETNSAAFIDVHDEKAKIRILQMDVVKMLLKKGKAKKVDPFTAPPIVSPKAKLRQARAWEALKVFRESDQSYLFDIHTLAALVRLAEADGKMTGSNIRIWLRRCLQGGHTPEGMLCKLSNCGRIPEGGKFVETGKKRGRKKRNADLRRKTLESPLNDEDREIFDKVIKTCLCGIANRRETYAGVWEKKLPPFYNEGLDDEDEDSEKRLIPSLRQFRNYIETTHWRKTIKISRRTTAANNSKGKSQNSEDESIDATGPCDILQIDSTRADVWLCVSETNKAVIGKPTVYLVVDVFTSMIVGVHVTLAAPSFHEACTALVTSVRNKVKLCADYEIPITEDDWPTTPLSKRLVADRQEFISLNSQLLGENYEIEIINPVKYSGFFKGLVESKIGKINGIAWTFPGGEDPLASKDEAPAYLDTCLTLKMFTRLLLIAIIKANARVNKSMPLPEGSFDKKIVKSPKDVMIWALKDIGTGREAEVSKLERDLLPKVERARTHRNGIRVSNPKVKGIFYDAGNNLPQDWFNEGNSRKLHVQYDPGTMNHVWVRHPDTDVVFMAPLSKRSREYRKLSWEEGAHAQIRQQTAIDEREIRADKRRREWDQLEEQILDHAKACALSQPKVYRTAALKNQTENRRKAMSIEAASRSASKSSLKFDPLYEN